jgi:glycine/D-amino acid oxidase-like deaminating enzyme
MDLRTGTAPWSTHHRTTVSLGPLARDERCDVLIVGTGISGAMAAFHLGQAGADVVLVDRRPLSTGSTSVSTALIQYELDQPLLELAPRLGPQVADDVYRATRVALEDMRHLIEGNDIACDFTQRPTLYLASSRDDIDLLRAETDARRRVGIEVSWLDETELANRYRLRRPGAIRSDVSFELNPRKLTAQLLEDAVARFGARIYDRTTLAVDPWVGATPTLRTLEGHSIRCHQVVYATGYETPEQFPALAGLFNLKSTFALSTQPLQEDQIWPERAMIWEHADPYFYARTLPDNRLLLGGEDIEATDQPTRDAAMPAKIRKLLARFTEATGLSAIDVDRTWAGTFAETDDSLPFLGTPTSAPKCFFNLGYGGNGILFSLIGAQILRDASMGKTHAAARLFGFDRPGLPDHLRNLVVNCP